MTTQRLHEENENDGGSDAMMILDFGPFWKDFLSDSVTVTVVSGI